MNVAAESSGSRPLIKQIKNMKQFSPSYLIQSAYNAAANEVAREMVCAELGIKEISRREALRIGMKTGGELNDYVNEVTKSGRAVPTRDRFVEIFTDLCRRHNVAFEGGIEEFVAGAWAIADSRN